MKQVGLFCSLMALFLATSAQTDLPFAGEIAAFKKQDSLNPPPTGAILFVGSSSFTNWKDVQAYFPNKTIINRGFGGSSLTHLIQYAGAVIFPYKPKQIVLYCGENDLAASDTVSAQEVSRRFMQLFTLIRQQMPAVHLLYVAMKPSPARWHLRKKMLAGNALIRRFLQRQSNTAFADTWPVMLAKTGRPNPALFLADSLHMNSTGYRRWQQLLARRLK